MEYIFITSRILAAEQLLGFFWTFILFAFCFIGVHILKLAGRGYSLSKAPPPQEKPPKKEPPKQEKQAPPKEEPVYYIVERKQRRTRPTYGEPKKISFKE